MELLFTDINQRNYDDLLSKEWLETNGLGGWSGTTLSGAHSRTYHGLLVVADNTPVNRKVIVSKLIEEIKTPSNFYEFDCNNYSGTIHPKGYNFLSKFTRKLNPELHYQTPEFEFSKSIVFIHHKNTVVLKYSLKGISEVQLTIRPLLAQRGIHQLNYGHTHINPNEHLFDNGTLNIPQYFNTIRNLKIKIPGSTYTEEETFYDNFYYQLENERGIECNENLYATGHFDITLKEGNDLYVVLSTEEKIENGEKLYEEELKRRTLLLTHFTSTPEYIQQLVLSADQFVVRRSKHLNSIIAGYHWFTDWGRDTMIALPGLCLVTGRFEEAKNILFAFAEVIDEGMIPNRFPENPEEVEYNTVDATLWYVIAIYKYYEYTNDKDVITKLFPVIDEIVRWHFKGTRYGIKVDSDNLITAGVNGVQLTWMDAKAGDWVVTPRIGKAVEINALWYNVLKIGSELASVIQNELTHKFYENLSIKVKQEFRSKFYINKGYLIDVISENGCDEKIRPNQIFALSLPFPLFSGVEAANIVATVEEHLLTPFGLRSLSPSDPEYKPYYTGDVWSRDGAYHQGTTWSWLIGAFITAKMRFGGVGKEKECLKILDHFDKHIKEYGLGSISEVFDATEPYKARGCIAQAWSVAEILRVYFEDIVD